MLNGVARARAEIDGCRHLVREAAHLMDTKGNTDAHTRQVCSLSRSPGRSRPSGMKRSRPPPSPAGALDRQGARARDGAARRRPRDPGAVARLDPKHLASPLSCPPPLATLTRARARARKLAFARRARATGGFAQVHGACGLSQDTPLHSLWLGARLLRLADGPDEVHWRKAGQLEVSYQRESRLRDIGLYTPARDATEPTFRYTTDPISAEASAAVSRFEDLMTE